MVLDGMMRLGSTSTFYPRFGWMVLMILSIPSSFQFLQTIQPIPNWPVNILM